MARSACPKCGATHFEAKEAEPVGAQFKLVFVQCKSCGAVVGVTEFYNLGVKLDKMQRKLSDIADKLGVR